MFSFPRRLAAFVPILISLLLGSVESRAQSATADTLSPAILPANTPVMLRLKKNLYKKDAKPGQPVEFEVDCDVVVNGQVLIQSGAAVTGSIREIHEAGKGPAQLLIGLGPAQTISGETVRLAWTERMTGSKQPGVADAVFGAGYAGPAFPVALPVLVVMTLFEKKVLLDKDALLEALVVAHVAEAVTLDPAKLKAAQAQLRETVQQKGLPKSSGDVAALICFFSTPVGKALALEQAGDLDGAIKEYQQALALKLDSPGLREDVLEVSPASLHFRIAELFRKKQDFVHAIPEYRAVVQLDPNDESVRIGLVNALEDSGDPENAALAEIKEAIRIWPNNVFFHYLLGQLLIKKNDPDAAIVELQWVLKQEKNHDWKANCALGRAYELKGDLKAALGQYRTAYRVRMDDQECRAAYERLHQQLK